MIPAPVASKIASAACIVGTRHPVAKGRIRVRTSAPRGLLSLPARERDLPKSPSVCFQPGLLINVRKIRVEPDNKRLARYTEMALIRQINLFRILNYKVTTTIEKWVKEEKMRLGRFRICCVNAQKEEGKSFPLKMPRSCWSGQYRSWDDSLDALSIR